MVMENSTNDVIKDLDAGVLDAYIGQRIKLRRTILKLSQDEVASMIGVTFQQVQKYENGMNRISAGRLFVLAKVLNVDVSFFFDGIEREVPNVETFCAVDGISEKNVSFDPMLDTETLKLVNAYWKIQNTEKRQKILDFILSMV